MNNIKLKISDMYEYISFGKLISKMENKDEIKGITPTLNNLMSKSWTAPKSSEEFSVPFYDSSTKKEHVSGYSKYVNFSGSGIKVSELGGYSILINGDSFIGKNAGILVGRKSEYNSEFMASFLNKFIPRFSQGTTQKMAMWSYYKNEEIILPHNFKEISKKISELKLYSKNSLNFLQDLNLIKKGILFDSLNNIDKDKNSVSLSLRDLFKVESGKGSFNKMIQNGMGSKIENDKEGFVIPVYSASAKGNHIVGWAKKASVKGPFIKVSVSGDPGRATFVKRDALLMEKSYAFKSEEFTNEYMALYLDYLIPKFAQGSAQKNAYFPNYNETIIKIPANHKELAGKISLIDDWISLTENNIEKIKKYIVGLVAIEEKGDKDE